MPLGAQSSYETPSGSAGSGPRTKRENRVGVVTMVLLYFILPEAIPLLSKWMILEKKIGNDNRTNKPCIHAQAEMILYFLYNMDMLAFYECSNLIASQK